MSALSRKRWPLYRSLVKRLIDRAVIPTGRLVVFCLLTAVPVLLAGLLAGAKAAWVVLLGCNALLLLFAVTDLLLLPRYRHWRVERQLPPRADLREQISVGIKLTLTQPLFTALAVEVVDDVPLSFEGALEEHVSADGSDTVLRLEQRKPHSCGQLAIGSHELELAYTTSGRQRGSYTFETLFVRYSGLLGLVQRQLRLPLPSLIRIYPDLSGVRGILASHQRALIIEGARLQRRPVGGSDFDHIREYVQGDEPRHLNWKASARAAKPMINMYQPEKGKIVTLLIECGRMMGVELDGRTRLDYALEAALALAAVVLRQGDYVALLIYDDKVRKYVSPGKGVPYLHVLTEAVFDLQPGFAQPDLSGAVAYLLQVQRKRSLAVVFSDLESNLLDKEAVPYLMRLRRTHLLLMISLEDPMPRRWTDVEADDLRTAFIHSAARKLALERKRYVHEMAARSIPVIDVPADRLTWRAVNAYLELKERDAL